MTKLIENLLLNETVIFNGTISDFKELIVQKKDLKFNFEWISENIFKSVSKLSVGTVFMDFKPNAVEGIKVFAELIELKNNKTQIKLSTKVRVEIYFMGIASLIFPFTFFFIEEDLPYWLLLLFPTVTIWFWFVYQFQEKILLKKVIRFIERK